MKKFSYLVAVCLAIVLSAFIPALAATNDLAVGDAGPYSYKDTAYAYAPENVIDLSETATTSNDVAILLNITAGSYVHAIVWNVEEAVTNASIAFSVGDTSSATTWASGVAATNTGWGSSSLSLSSASTSFPVSVTSSSGGKFYSSADEIRLKFNLNPGSTGKIRVKPIISYSPDRD